MPDPASRLDPATCRARIAAEDHRWNAMLVLAPDDGDRRPAAGPLHGLTLAVKDNIDVAGMATTSGCRAMAGAMPRANAAVMDRLLAAGAVVIGKTNLSEFSFEVRSRSSLGGDVRCPFAPDASAGGSSGGSAVAVARGFAWAAIGTDTGGSIRIPAACNGLVGLRPAHGMLPLGGVAPLAPSTDTIGPIARTVADAERLYRAMGGTIAATAIPAAPPRLGVLRQAFGDDPRIVAACERTLHRLAQAGMELVDPFTIPDIEALLAGPHIVDAEFAAAFDDYLARNFLPGTAPANLAAILAGGDFLPDHRKAITERLVRKPGEAAAILERHGELTATLVQAMAAHRLDGLVHPTMRVIPEGLGNPSGGWAPELAARTGWPAISVPAPTAPDERPVGVELLVPAGREGLLFDLARTMEGGAGT
ncbi:amidase [Novosphingobium resinovorum]|uniref:amidase n=1 Tax=Novosphingobium resinovorum TaxID=158500 RepID=UPI002ED54862|nr:amidase [Novosphingobium resinovorum]